MVVTTKRVSERERTWRWWLKGCVRELGKNRRVFDDGDRRRMDELRL